MSDSVKQVTYCLEESGNEAVYIAGELKYEGSMCYMIDLIDSIGDPGQLVRIKMIKVELVPFDLDWPKTLEELAAFVFKDDKPI